MSRTTSGGSGSDWPIAKFIFAITGLITAVAGLLTVFGNPLTPDPRSTPRSDAGYTAATEQRPDPQPTRTPQPTETTAPSRGASLREIKELQTNTIEALIAGDQLEANNLLEESESLIDDALDRWPEDIEFMNLRGYHYKNMAMTLLQLQMETKVEDYLAEA